MNNERLTGLFRDARIDADFPNWRAPSLSAFANETLRLTGLKLEELDRIEQAFASKPKNSTLSLTIGSGFAAWSITQSAGLLDHAIEDGHEIGLFVCENIDTLTAGWDEALPVVAVFLAEFVLRLPSGSLALGSQILDLFAGPNLIAEAIGMKLDTGIAIADALDLVGLGADVADVIDGASTLGVSLLLSWATGKLTKKYYAPQIEERRQRLESLLAQHVELIKLRQMLKTELPSAVIAGHLEHVDARHWGF